MHRLTATGLAFVLGLVAISGCAPTARVPSYSLAAVQGGWWSACDAPAVEFAIHGDKYVGDFEGSHTLRLTGNVLEFTEGLIGGHGTSVTHEALSFEILKVNDTELVLRPLPGNPRVGDWRLLSCE